VPFFDTCYSAFRSAVKRAELDLPDGQLSHVLRHTFASHFMMNGGNILVLQRILGHTDIKMTMRYGHFTPNHLEDALKTNPMKAMDNESWKGITLSFSFKEAFSLPWLLDFFFMKFSDTPTSLTRQSKIYLATLKRGVTLAHF